MGERDYNWKFILMVLLLGIWAWACYPLSAISQGIDLRGGADLEFTLKSPEGRVLKASDLLATIEVLQRRIDLLGVKEVNLEPSPPNHFRVEYPGADPNEVDDIIKTITKAGQLWFRIVQTRTPNQQFAPEKEYLLQVLSQEQANKLVPTDADLEQVEAEMADTDAANDKIRRYNETRKKGAKEKKYQEYERTIHLCRIPEEKAKKIRAKGQTVPEGHDKPFKIICYNDKPRRIDGKYLDTGKIRRQVSGGGKPAVGFEFDGPRKRDFAKLTEDNIDKPMAIILDGSVLSAPNINSRIFGAGIIEGDMNEKEVDRLIITLKSGALPAKPKLESKNFIGPSLGRDAINRGFMAIYIGSGLILIFMMIYYFGSGVVAVIAMIMNLVFIIGSLALLDATLTLPGIAGIILTVGMAVDANILIFERIREERLLGKSVRQAMKSGYDRAFWTIFDANLTTALTAFILFKVGTGPIRGFATTLLIGIIASMFTSLFCTKAIFSFLLTKKMITQFKMMYLIKKPSIQFLKLRVPAMALSICLIVGGMFMFFNRGEEKYGIDFTGGTLFRLVFQDYQLRSDIEKNLKQNIPLKGIDTMEVKSVHLTGGDVAKTMHAQGKAMGFMVRTRIQPNLALSSLDNDILTKIKPEVKDYLIKQKEGQLVPTEQGKTDYTAKDFTAGELISAMALNLFKTDLALPGWPSEDEVLDSLDYGEQVRVGTRAGRIVFRVNLFKPTVSIDNATAYYRDRLEEVEESTLGRVRVEDVSKVGLSEKDQEKFVQLQIETEEAVKIDNKYKTIQDYLHSMKTVFNVAAASYGSVSENMPESSNVAPRAAHNLRSKAFIALVLAAIAILIYITFRFEFRFAVGAIAALVHDVLFAMGAIAVIDWAGLVDVKLSLPIIAAFLTIIGYSLNDTIVLFDRVRENMGKQAREKKVKNSGDFADLINVSINETLSRTVLTSLTTMLVVLVLFLSGVQTIQGFALTLIIGVIVGTFSSIFIASPVLLMLQKREPKLAAATAAAAPQTAQAASVPAGEKKVRTKKRVRRNKPENNNS